MDIQALRKMRNNDFSKISGEFEKIANPRANNREDDRFWKPERDKAGNASATIRFLPKTEGDELPWVRVFSHGFQGPSGLWYIENSLTTFDEPDPVSELNSKLWNSTTDDNSPQRKQARDQRRRLQYIANVLVVDDPKHPENNGQVKLFKFGKKIFDKIMDKARPTFEDEDPVNVFDYWEGANFKLRMKQVAGYPNYDTSVFADPSPLSDDEEEILKVANAQHKLSEFLDKSKHFKTYDQLKARLETVLNSEGGVGSAAKMAEEDTVDFEPAPSVQAKAPASKPAPSPASEDEDDDAMSFFQRIADED
jgi:hypothetical protein